MYITKNQMQNITTRGLNKTSNDKTINYVHVIFKNSKMAPSLS